MAGPGNILIKVGAETAGAVAGLKNVNSALDSTHSTTSKSMAGIQKAAIPAAIAFAAVGAAALDMTKAAAEDAKAQKLLAGSLERTAGATAQQVKATEDYITKLSMQTGIADDELRPAMAKLASATGDVGLAQKDLAVALDISAQSGKSVSVVSAALAKAYDGSTGSLKKLVPGLDAATLKAGDMTKIMAELADKTGGAAAEAASTAEGQYAVMNVKMNELKESIGAGLLPVMTQLTSIMGAAVDVAAKHTTVVKILIGVIAAFAAGILALNAVLKVYRVYQAIFVTETAGMTVAQRALNLAMEMNPIGLVILALTALGIGLVIAYKKSETFRAVVQAAFAAVKVAVDALGRAFEAVLAAASSAFTWITQHWTTIAFAFGPLGIAIGLLAKNFDAIKAAGVAAFNAIKAAVDGVYNAIKAAINLVGDLVGKISHIPSLPHIGVPWMVPPTGPTAALAGARSTSTSGTTINVYGAVDPEGTARAIRRILDAHDRRQGRLVGG